MIVTFSFTGAILGHQLTEVDLMNSHLNGLVRIKPDDLKKQVQYINLIHRVPSFMVELSKHVRSFIQITWYTLSAIPHLRRIICTTYYDTDVSIVYLAIINVQELLQEIFSSNSNHRSH